MNLGPIEIVAINFPENKFEGKILAALNNLVERNIIRIIDILFVTKDQNGKLSVLEITDLQDADYQAFDPLVADLTGLLSETDAHDLSEHMPNNSSNAIMLFENTWATRFVNAVRATGGKLILNQRIPREVVEEILAVQDN